MNLLQLLLGSFKRRGVVKTVVWGCSEFYYDFLFGIKTAKLHLSEVKFEDVVLRDAAAPYQGTNWLLLKDVFETLQGEFTITPATTTFVDLGSGAGRVMVFALNKRYRRVVGVEFEAKLCAQSRRNIELYTRKRPVRPGQNWEIVNGDASRFDLPPETSVVFLYNPFGEPVIGTVAANLKHYALGQNRGLVIVYVNPVCLDAFTSRGFAPVARLGEEASFLMLAQN